MNNWERQFDKWLEEPYQEDDVYEEIYEDDDFIFDKYRDLELEVRQERSYD